MLSLDGAIQAMAYSLDQALTLDRLAEGFWLQAQRLANNLAVATGSYMATRRQSPVTQLGQTRDIPQWAKTLAQASDAGNPTSAQSPVDVSTLQQVLARVSTLSPMAANFLPRSGTGSEQKSGSGPGFFPNARPG